MKKIMLTFLMVFTFGVAFLVAGCCGDDPNKEFVSMAIKDGTMPTVNVGSTPNFSNVVVVISYMAIRLQVMLLVILIYKTFRTVL